MLLDSYLDKIRVPFHLLSRVKSDRLLDLNCYLLELVHSMKMAASVAVPSEKIKLNTRKRGWSDFPGLKVEKSRHVFWRQIWVDCERPRSGWVFKIMKSSKHQYQKKVKSWKRSRVKELSREIKNNPRQLWREVS